MKPLLEKLFCKHKWKEMQHIAVFCNEQVIDNTRPLYHKYLYVCENCGKLKKVKL